MKKNFSICNGFPLHSFRIHWRPIEFVINCVTARFLLVCLLFLYLVFTWSFFFLSLFLLFRGRFFSFLFSFLKIIIIIFQDSMKSHWKYWPYFRFDGSSTVSKSWIVNWSSSAQGYGRMSNVQYLSNVVLCRALDKSSATHATKQVLEILSEVLSSICMTSRYSVVMKVELVITASTKK